MSPGCGVHHADRVTRAHWEDSPEAEPYLLALARLTLITHTLEHQVTELGRALGVDVDAAAPLGAVRVLRRQLEDSLVPPWAAPEAGRRAIESWLTSAAECLGLGQAFTLALQSGQGSPQLIDVKIGRTTRVGLEDYDQLTHRCRNYVELGTDLLDALAMRTESGGRLFGYFAIAQALWSAVNDEPGVRPTTQPLGATPRD